MAVSQMPSATELALPRASRQLFTRLSAEPVGDWDTLLDRCTRHAAALEGKLGSNEFLPVEEAQQLIAVLRRLVARVREEGSPVARQLTWALGRYFEIADDGEVDFAIGGLDDDVQVFNAVLEYLGFEDLLVTT